MDFQSLRVTLNLYTKPFTDALNGARAQAQKFSSALAQAAVAGSADKLVDGYTSLNDRLHKVGLGLRDISRIAAGITISQTFYATTRAIREATSALWDFNESLDYAQVTYSALFNSTSLAQDFIDTLKQFSIETIFEYTDIEGMARKLSAYGIEYKNLMFIIEGLTNIGTISGDTAALERLAVAIGQINAKGTLKAEELRQLANAYTPIYDILREKLGLSEEQLARVGDLGISSADAINAIIEYANEQFGATADAAVNTITGLNNKIVDSLKVLGANMLQPISTFYKSFAKYVADGLSTISAVYAKGGAGGVFEYLVPDPAWQERIRAFIASIKNAVSIVITTVQTLWPSIRQIIGGLIDAATVFLTIINTVGNAIVGVFRTIAENTPIIEYLTKALVAAAAAWLLFKIQALGAAAIAGLKVLLVGIAKLVVSLATAIMAHPLISMLMLIGAVLIGLAANANSADNAISKLIKSLSSYSLGGSTSDDILQVGEAMDSTADKSDQFWHKMEDDATSTGDAVEDAADKAAKAAKGLLSFDEVFKLPEDASAAANTVGVDSPDLSGIADLAGALGDLGTAIVPEIPDLSSFAKDFVNTLYNDLWDALKTIATGAATGALIGGLVGFVIGGLVTHSMAGALTGAKWGAAIGGIAGGAFAAFWTTTYKELEKTLIKIAVGGATGVLIGGLVGMVIGAFATRTLDGALTGAKWGAAIGGLLGGGIGAFWAAATEEIESSIEGLIVGTSIGALTGGLVGLVLGAFATKTLDGALTGAKWGAAIGGLLGGGLGAFIGSANTELKNALAKIATGAAEGALIGGLAGLILGAVAVPGNRLQGALTGAKYGALLGGMIQGTLAGVFGDAEASVSDSLKGLFSKVQAASTGMFFGGLAGMIVGAIIGAFAGGVGALPGARVGATLGAAAGGLIGYVHQALKDSGTVEAIGNWWSDLWSNVSGWLGTAWSTSIAWLGSVSGSVGAWFVNAFTDISKWFADTWKAITGWFSDLFSNIGQWLASAWTAAGNWFVNVFTGIGTWLANTWTAIINWFSNLFSNIGKWFADTWTAIMGWFSELFSNIGKWFTNTWSAILGWFSSLFSSIGRWLADVWGAISNWFVNTMTGIGKWLSSVWDKISGWFSGLTKDVSNWWRNLWNPDTWKNGWDSIKGWFSNLWDGIAGWFKDIGKAIADWWDGLWGDKKASVDVSGTVSTFGGGGSSNGSTGAGRRSIGAEAYISGHATGGIFNREHIARFAEGNRAEAIIPLENQSAMQPFVDAISSGILQGMLPAMAGGASSPLPPMYVGTLVADDRGLQQLYKKFEVYEAKELARKGLTT